ncbi:hypothetical protein [Streptomyces sp. SCL15-6]|uniref:hypothetical protein n=1 Tax=Streptomyces sp. SCL15-6 TaxID=2967222 RepID=UPI0029672E8C|nr:hypothetical protein [Streptomyces sp. SCL15-6]
MLQIEHVRHGGAGWSNLKRDLGHPGQGFALAYVPTVGRKTPARPRPSEEQEDRPQTLDVLFHQHDFEAAATFWDRDTSSTAASSRRRYAGNG